MRELEDKNFGTRVPVHRAKWKCSALTRDAQEALAMRDIHIAADTALW